MNFSNFSEQIKSRISFYLIISLLSGVLLWILEGLERSTVLYNKFIQPGEVYLFSSYLVFTALGSLLWGMFLIMCSTTRLATFQLVNPNPLNLKGLTINGKWKQTLVSSLALLSIFILLWISIHTYFTKQLYKMVAGLVEPVSYLRSVFEYRQLATFLILLGLAFLLTLLTEKLEDIAGLKEEKPKISKTPLFLTISAILVLPISYYIDANFMVTRRDLSFHLPLYLSALIASLMLASISYQWFISNKLGKTIISIFVIAIFVASGISIQYFHSNQNLKSLFWRRSVIAKRYGNLVRKVAGQRHKDYIALLGTTTVKPLLNHNSDNHEIEDEELLPSLSTNLFTKIVNADTLKAVDYRQPRNIIFLSIDTLRADHMGVYGYSRNITPNLDKFAKQSIFCERGYSTGTNTGHSFASILRSALGDGIFDSNTPTITQILKQSGYQTAFITSPKTEAWLNKKRWMDYKKILMDGFEQVPHQESKFWNAQEMTDRSIDMIKNLKGKEPFFAWIHYTDPHTPYEHHPEYDFGKGDINIYDSEIAYTDAHIGRLLQFLTDSKLMQNTMIVFTSDHGEGFNEHGESEHGSLPYVEQCFVPMWVYTPEMPSINLSIPLSHIDLAPTMLEFANIAPPQNLYEGKSITSIVRGETTAHPYVISETPRNIPEPTFFAWALTKNNWRLIYDKVGSNWQLYNLDKDPYEQANLADLEPIKLKELKDELVEYLNQQALRENYSRWKSLKCMAKKKPKRFRQALSENRN